VVTRTPVAARRAALRPVVRFSVRRARVVRFHVVQLAPRCARIGSFRRKLHRGMNTLRLPRRIDGRVLRPGTYRVMVRLGDRRVSRVVAVGRVPLENACAVEAVTAATAAVSSGAPAAPPPRSGVAAAERSHVQLLAAQGETATPARGGVLGARFTFAPPASGPLRLLFFLAAAFAVLLLVASALPRSLVPAGAGAALLVQRRRELAFAGVLVLAAVEIAFLISR
jgi:hypothetical protein